MVSALETPLASIRGALRGVVPSAIATTSADGVPNVTYLSIVSYVDEERVALSNQFMSKTLVNIRENPQVAIRVIDPETMHEYDIDARYVRSEVSGELFDAMRAQLEAVAAQVGMEDAFRLRCVEVLQVDACRPSSGGEPSVVPESSGTAVLGGLGVFFRRLGGCRDLSEATRVAL